MRDMRDMIPTPIGQLGDRNLVNKNVADFEAERETVLRNIFRKVVAYLKEQLSPEMGPQVDAALGADGSQLEVYVERHPFEIDCLAQGIKLPQSTKDYFAIQAAKEPMTKEEWGLNRKSVVAAVNYVLHTRQDPWFVY